MFKVFLLFLVFFVQSPLAFAQERAFNKDEGSVESMLSKYINASAVCAKMTDPKALYERGMLLIEDANSDAYIAASDCFTSAAMRNHTPSQLELGKLYEKGMGVNQSIIFAYKWYQTAVLLGNNEARSFRDSLESRMTLDDISMANPMIQDTLNLLDLLNTRQQEEINRFERQVADSYRSFGVNIEEYDIKDEGTSSYQDNPLIEALIREQQKKEEMQRDAMRRRGETGEEEQPTAGRRRRRGGTQQEEQQQQQPANDRQLLNQRLLNMLPPSGNP